MKLPLLFGLIIVVVAATMPVHVAFATQDAAPIKADVDSLEKNLIDSGKFYFASKNYKAAIQQWSTALTLNPKNKIIYRYIDEAKLKINETEPDVDTIYAKAGIKSDMAVYSVNGKQKTDLSLQDSLSLKDCLKIAETNYIPLQVARRNLKLAEQRLWEAKRNLLPTFGIRFDEYSGRVNAKAYIGRKQYVEGQHTIQGGELFYTLKQAELNKEIVKNDYAKSKNELTLQVKKAYYTLLRAQENMKLQTELAKASAVIFDRVQKSYDANLIPRIDYLNVSSQANQIKFQLYSAQGDEDMSELILKQAMYVTTKDKIHIKPVGKFMRAAVDFDKALAAALMNRPEMKINSLMIDYYRYEKKIAASKSLPKLTLMGNWGLAKEEYASQDQSHTPPNVDNDQKLEQQWYAGFKIGLPMWGSTGEYSWTKEQWTPVVSAYQGTEAVTNSYKFNFLDNLKMYSDSISADLEFDRSRQELSKITQDVTLETQETCFTYDKAVLQLATAESKVIFQAQDLEVVKMRRELDEAQEANVIDSMVKLAQEKFGYVQALMDCFIAVASINKAVGVDDYYKCEEETTGTN